MACTKNSTSPERPEVRARWSARSGGRGQHTDCAGSSWCCSRWVGFRERFTRRTAVGPPVRGPVAEMAHPAGVWMCWDTESSQRGSAGPDPRQRESVRSLTTTVVAGDGSPVVCDVDDDTATGPRPVKGEDPHRKTGANTHPDSGVPLRRTPRSDLSQSREAGHID